MKLVFILVCLLAIRSYAGVFEISIENDMFHTSDRHYTHGTRISYDFDSAPLWTDFIKGERTWVASIGQYMYTPSDISIPTPILDDRPYGGWLYLENILCVRNNNWMDMYGLDLGITGPPALCEETQKMIHKWTDSRTPMGWKYQVGTEIGIDLTYQKKYRWRHNGLIDFDVIPSAGGCLGDIFIYTDAQLMARFGLNVPDNFGFLKMEPASRVNGLQITSIYGCIMAEERYVLRNIFLDGHNSQSVEKEDFVSDLGAGIGFSYDKFEILWMDNFRTREFKIQKENDKYTTLAICWRF